MKNSSRILGVIRIKYLAFVNLRTVFNKKQFSLCAYQKLCRVCLTLDAVQMSFTTKNCAEDGFGLLSL